MTKGFIIRRSLALAFAIFTGACASSAPEAPPAPTPTVAAAQPPVSGLAIYEGTYTLQAPSRMIQLRVWLAEGKLNGELVGTGNQTVMRESGEPHKFLHATADDIWFQFIVENGRATSATMHQRGREISGAKTQ